MYTWALEYSTLTVQEALDASVSRNCDRTEYEDVRGAVTDNIGVQAHVALPCRSIIFKQYQKLATKVQLTCYY